MVIPRGRCDEEVRPPGARCWGRQATETFNLRAYYKVYNAKKRKGFRFETAAMTPAGGLFAMLQPDRRYNRFERCKQKSCEQTSSPRWQEEVATGVCNCRASQNGRQHIERDSA